MSLNVGDPAGTPAGGIRDSIWKPGLRTPMAIEKDLTVISFTVLSSDKATSSLAASG